MTTEDEVRELVSELLFCITDTYEETKERENAAVAALMRLVGCGEEAQIDSPRKSAGHSSHEPPSTGVPIEWQIDALRVLTAIEGGQYSKVAVVAALETLRWVQGLREAGK
jgi:hypothetical protein